jgi:hypothetical protein
MNNPQPSAHVEEEEGIREKRGRFSERGMEDNVERFSTMDIEDRG